MELVYFVPDTLSKCARDLMSWISVFKGAWPFGVVEAIWAGVAITALATENEKC
jgi:hypothetical protein